MSQKIRLLAFASALALCASSPALSADAPPNTLPAPPNPMTDVQKIDTKTFVPNAAQSDMFEIKAAELAMSRSKTDGIKMFAEEMKKAHTETTGKLMPLAKSAGVEPPTKMDDDHEAMLKSLADAKDEDFDKAYIDGQVSAHEKAVALFQTYSTTGDNEPLMAFAKETAPTIQIHLDHAKMLQQSLSDAKKISQ